MSSQSPFLQRYEGPRTVALPDFALSSDIVHDLQRRACDVFEERPNPGRQVFAFLQSPDDDAREVTLVVGKRLNTLRIDAVPHEELAEHVTQFITRLLGSVIVV
jgi:hypothetical protein